MTLVWIGVGMMVVGLAMILFGSRSSTTNTMTVHGSSGTFVQGVEGDVNIGHASGSAPKLSAEDRFLKWGGFIVGLLGVIVAAAKLFTG